MLTELRVPVILRMDCQEDSKKAHGVTFAVVCSQGNDLNGYAEERLTVLQHVKFIWMCQRGVLTTGIGVEPYTLGVLHQSCQLLAFFCLRFVLLTHCALPKGSQLNSSCHISGASRVFRNPRAYTVLRDNRSGMNRVGQQVSRDEGVAPICTDDVARVEVATPPSSSSPLGVQMALIFATMRQCAPSKREHFRMNGLPVTS